jgi:twitching motility protein PilJ
MDNVAGKGRNIGTNVWLGLLVVSLVVFGANTAYSISKAARLGGASTAASNLQVNSQRLANQGREAVGGNAES